VGTRNITFNLPEDLIKRAKVHAAQHDTTVNALVRELLEEKLSQDTRARKAAKELLAIAERGPYFTIDPGSISREELHERR
jgi:plasmid stability protein